MKNRLIITLALAGVGGIVLGGTLWGLLGVAALLLAVFGVCENDRLAVVNRELDRVYGAVPAATVRPRADRNRVLQLAPAR